ncbi:MAG: VanZ family protein [Cyanobacteria bacterium P01_G01_bin.39]
MNSITNSKYWGYFVLTISIGVILVATISPFDFLVTHKLSWRYIINEFKFGSNLKDYWQNILLFISWGFGIAAIISRKQKSHILVVLACFAASATLSITVEITQIFLPSRVSNLTDIICNTIGGTIGGVLYYYQRNTIKFILAIITGNIEQLSIKSIVKVFIIYCSLIALAITVLFNSVNLNTWDDYYLAFGNEVSGDRPWQGYLNNLYVSDRAFNIDQVKTALGQANTLKQDYSSISAASFNHSESFYRDHNNLLPDLHWQKTNQQINGDYDQSIYLNKNQWLKSQQKAKKLVNHLKVSNEFTLSLSLAPSDIYQAGYGRIFALSAGIYAHNLILAQQENDLYIRLRTSVSGSNATEPELFIPDVFQDNSFHQIIIVFSNRKISCYLDQLEQRYSFTYNPDTTFSVFLPWRRRQWQINLKYFSAFKSQIVFYLIIFVPLILLSTILTIRFILRANL